MRHVVVVGDVFNGCGRGIFPGLRRRWSAMFLFVVRTSQMGSASEESFSSELSSVRMRLLVAEAASLRSVSDLIRLRRAVEAFSV